MNLINKKDGFPFEKALLILSLLDDVTHVVGLGIGGRQCHKPYAVLLAAVGYDVSQSGLEETETHDEKLPRRGRAALWGRRGSTG